MEHNDIKTTIQASIQPTTLPNIIAKRIVFISDLHFDFTAQYYDINSAPKMQSDFIAYVKCSFSDSLLCLAGDYYNDYKKTLDFIKELEFNKIAGFCVLGNHDFWNKRMYSHKEILHFFEKETINHKYFKLLITGQKYFVNDICVIGDTGWTSFRRRTGRVMLLSRFMRLPDAKNVKDFNPAQIISLHNDWIDFANKTLSQEEKVLIITHFPMVDFTRKAKDCWWSSSTRLQGDNSWRIFGHTHDDKQQRHNNISSQRGYDNRKDLVAERCGQYSEQSFGMLEKISAQYNIENLSSSIIAQFYSPLVVLDTNQDTDLISNIEKDGYKRCSANKLNIAALAANPEEYIDIVTENINGYLGDIFIGYLYTNIVPKDIIDAVLASIAILKKKNFVDVREFMIAAVITGFVFNDKVYAIRKMRPISNYDVMRFWLMFVTIKKYKIRMNSIESIRKNSKSYITFCNVDIYLPSVNGLSLTIEEAQKLMCKMPLFSKSLPSLAKVPPNTD